MITMKINNHYPPIHPPGTSPSCRPPAASSPAASWPHRRHAAAGPSRPWRTGCRR